MKQSDSKALIHCFRLLGKMAEREPSLVSTRSWQMATEGIATMAKLANLTIPAEKKIRAK